MVGEVLKDALQMLIGCGIVGLLAFKLLSHWPSLLPIWLHWLHGWKTLEIVGAGLAYSAGLDLSYMLFTPGPDEAVEPLLLGLASAVLLEISRSDAPTSFAHAAAIGLLVVMIAALFLVRELLVAPDVDPDVVRSWLRRWLEAGRAGGPP